MKKSLKQFSKKATGLLLAVAVTGTSFGLPGLTREVQGRRPGAADTAAGV